MSNEQDKKPRRYFHGTFCHAPMRGEVEIFPDTLIGVDIDGLITDVVRPGDEAHAQTLAEARASGRVEALKGYVLPGFCDLHVHAPQWPQIGKALHVPLEVWLQSHTFPLEARYADETFAEQVYEALVEDLLGNGTTTALYFASIHVEATKRLADICLKRGQRALIGKVAMDNADQCPEFYRESTDEALKGTQEVITYIRQLKDGRIQPVVTPRFIPSCTDAALEGLGELAQSCGCHIQTHCSESDWQHHHVLGRYGVSDTRSLDRFGLLGERTVLAHGNYLGDDDLGIIADRGAAIAHCPLSNIYFSDAVFPLARALEKGVRIGLGSDISGGPSSFLFDTVRTTVSASRLLHDGVDPAVPYAERTRRGSRIDWRTAFHLATRGGAQALGLPVGVFQTGMSFDAFQVDPEARSGTIHVIDGFDSDLDALQKVIYTASRANIARVWVAGKRVAGQNG